MSRIRYFTVTGEGSFPFDMLCHDQCFPVSQKEADKITLACPTVAPRQSITLATRLDGRPNFNAWRERKWPVEHVE